MVKDDEEKTGETGGSTSMKSEVSTLHIQSSHLREQLKGCLSHTTTEPITSLNHSISLSVALFCN